MIAADALGSTTQNHERRIRESTLPVANNIDDRDNSSNDGSAAPSRRLRGGKKSKHHGSKDVKKSGTGGPQGGDGKSTQKGTGSGGNPNNRVDGSGGTGKIPNWHKKDDFPESDMCQKSSECESNCCVPYNVNMCLDAGAGGGYLGCLEG
eukprot:CAMPEP_0197441720 /NCGR_PEP_ID=MMETSP1175-20131217/7928_1 /TAXON_ID=1003142 /ORGANISM="Triceratium dubium, Strain CCMP147" /LENGTH=149 /DNA_ID=CAMNT_0042972049 /DNA_START=129 /DNA_END=578 /DNA_ORIENTATION=+